MSLEGPVVKKVENCPDGKRVRIDIPTDAWEMLCEMGKAEHRPPEWQLEVVIIDALDRWFHGSGLWSVSDSQKSQWRPLVISPGEMVRNDELIEAAEEGGG